MPTKRDSLKRFTAVCALSAVVPAKWSSPVVKSVITPAHAQTSTAAPTISNRMGSASSNPVEPNTIITVDATIGDTDNALTELSWRLFANGREIASGTGQFAPYQYTALDGDDPELIISLEVSDPNGNSASAPLFTDLVVTCRNMPALATVVATEYFVSPAQFPGGFPMSLQEIDRANGLSALNYFASQTFGGPTTGSTLTPSAALNLQAVATALITYPGATITIEGHTAECGTNEANIALGTSRAQAVQDELVALGVNPTQLRILSYGEERPFCVSSTLSCWQTNSVARLVLSSAG